MKTRMITSLISLALLLNSCQSEEKSAEPLQTAQGGGWVIYPPLSALKASQRDSLLRIFAQDSLRAARMRVELERRSSQSK